MKFILNQSNKHSLYYIGKVLWKFLEIGVLLLRLKTWRNIMFSLVRTISPILPAISSYIWNVRLPQTQKVIQFQKDFLPEFLYASFNRSTSMNIDDNAHRKNERLFYFR